MRAVIEKSRLSGTLVAPPSKSMAHRALISAALAEGKSTVTNIALSNDISATVESLRSLGARIEIVGDNATVVGMDKTDTGRCELYANESGSTLRFLIPICLTTGRECVIHGTKRLFERPLDIYKDICQSYGFRFDRTTDSVTVCGHLKPGRYEMSGEISSQFITGLMFALPLVGGGEVVLTGNVESKPYIKMTSAVLRSFGITADFDGNRTVKIEAGRYRPTDYEVECDASNAAFFEAFNYIGGDVAVVGIDESTLQGDAVYADYFARLTSGDTLSTADCPDLAPIMFALAAELGGCRFTGARRLAIKESNRITAMAGEIAKLGGHLTFDENSVTVEKTELHTPTEPISSHNDHRIAMAMSVLLSKYGGEIDGCEAVNKSYPDFYERFASLGGKVTFYDD